MPTDIKKILISVSINKVSTFFICSDFLVVGTRGSLGGMCTVYKGVPVSKTTAWDCRNGKALLWFKHKCLQMGTAVHRNWQLHFLLPDVNSLRPGFYRSSSVLYLQTHQGLLQLSLVPLHQRTHKPSDPCFLYVCLALLGVCPFFHPLSTPGGFQSQAMSVGCLMAMKRWILCKCKLTFHTALVNNQSWQSCDCACCYSRYLCALHENM